MASFMDFISDLYNGICKCEYCKEGSIEINSEDIISNRKKLSKSVKENENKGLKENIYISQQENKD